MKKKLYYTYLTTNDRQTVIYTGMTNNLSRRMTEHKNGKSSNSFTNQYHASKLVYYEIFNCASEAIKREKQIKAGPRNKKIELIKRENPNFNDLAVVISDVKIK